MFCGQGCPRSGMLYPQHFIDDLKTRADIVGIIGARVELKKKGSNWMARCPFHDEKTPSFSVHPRKAFYKCFGCGKGGNVYTFLMEVDGLTFPEAVKEVAEKSGVPLPEPVDDETYQRSKKKREKKKALAEQVIELNQIALEFWEECLFSDKPEAKAALKYLKDREIDEETIKHFRIGYAPDTWDSVLNLLNDKGADEKLIEQSGLVSVNEEKKRVYDRFRGRIIFPVLDLKSRPVAFGARILDKGEPKYLNSPETPAYVKGQHLYGLVQSHDEIRKKKFAILVEGYMDLIALYQFGISNVVASLGTAFTTEQAKLLGRFARKVVVNYDGDGAGVKAAQRAIETLLARDFDIKVLVLPQGADPDDFIRANGADSYNLLRGKAFPYLQFVLEQVAKGRNLALPKQKAEAIEEVVPLLASIGNTVEKRETLKQALSFFEINDRIVENHIWKEISQRKAYEKRVDANLKRSSVRDVVIKRNSKKATVAEERLLELLIHDAELRKELLPQLEETDYESLATVSIFETLIELEDKGAEVTSEILLELTKEDPVATEILPILLISESPREEGEALDDVLIEAEKQLISLRKIALDERILKNNRELVLAEQSGDVERIAEVVKEQIDLGHLKRQLQGKDVE
ncbi:MAG: DNA primase [Pyrinomonadaceae bacterium]|nr:DNA primase [Pyrinomonadaceae bacterium]